MTPSADPAGTMSKRELASLVSSATCRVFGHEQAGNDAHRYVLGQVIKAFDDPRATVLCEPSLTSNSMTPPDVVLVDSEAGVHVIEVKGIGIEQVLDVPLAGIVEIMYPTGPAKKAVIDQVRKAMFAIKNALQMQGIFDLKVNFDYWVMFPRIRRSEWKWSWAPPEVLFMEDCEFLKKLMTDKGRRWLKRQEADFWTDHELSQVRKAFGCNAAIMPAREPRPSPKSGSLGEMFDEAATAYRAPSAEQQALIEEVWEEGPRQIRGVAGSGKTIVLAANLARRIERIQPAIPGLTPGHARKPKIGVLCFNRKLVPFLKTKLNEAYKQRTGHTVDVAPVELMIAHMNGLYHAYSDSFRAGWKYMTIDSANEEATNSQGRVDEELAAEIRAAHFLSEWRRCVQNWPEHAETCKFDAIYVDEGQDLHPHEFTLLGEMCHKASGGEPNLVWFYDDAQNLYARPRPTWKECGLNVVGRTTVMGECHRNTRLVVESAFNVLYGTYAPEGSKKPSKGFGDIPGLEEKDLIEQEAGGRWRVKFARREGTKKPEVTVSSSWEKEVEQLLARVRWLTQDQEVRPEDILILTKHRATVDVIAKELQAAALNGVRVNDATSNKDEGLSPRGTLEVSTAHSAKGYDAYVVLIAAANLFEDSIEDRAAFYVACTRAREWLELFAHSNVRLVAEMKKAVAGL